MTGVQTCALPILPKSGLPGQARIPQAAWMLTELTHARQLADFLTLPAYALLP